MRQVIHAKAWFSTETNKRVEYLCRMQSSAKRCTYQAIHKHGLMGEDVRRHVKSRFGDQLNTRMISDAVHQAKAVEDKHVLFGGKRAWQEMLEGKQSKEEWKANRDLQLYARGDRTKSGNPNVRLYGDRILVNDPSARGEWIEGRLWWPEKFKGKLDLGCYDVRLVGNGSGAYKVIATWEDGTVVKDADFSRGAIGVDCNPNGMAVVEVDGDGNLLNHVFLHDSRLEHARHGKRLYAARQMAIKAVEMAQEAGKPLVMEELSIRPTKRGEKARKGRRRCNSFASQLQREAIISRGQRCGVPVVQVNPAYTSVLGLLKYAKMYSLNRHAAAALVIARRGMGIRERKDFKAVERPQRRTRKETSRTQATDEGGRLNLEGRGRSASIKSKGHTWFVDSFLKPRRGAYAVLTAPNPAPVLGSKAGKRLRTQGESPPTTAQGRQQKLKTVEMTVDHNLVYHVSSSS